MREILDNVIEYGKATRSGSSSSGGRRYWWQQMDEAKIKKP